MLCQRKSATRMVGHHCAECRAWRRQQAYLALGMRRYGIRPPDWAQRLALYTARAALGLPLFAGVDVGVEAE